MAKQSTSQWDQGGFLHNVFDDIYQQGILPHSIGYVQEEMNQTPTNDSQA